MRITGYCDQCHKFRPVNVRQFVPRGVQHGICNQCEDEPTPEAIQQWRDGYCDQCHKFRPVNVRQFVPRGVQHGICNQCEDEPTPEAIQQWRDLHRQHERLHPDSPNVRSAEQTMRREHQWTKRGIALSVNWMWAVDRPASQATYGRPKK
jgi:hypothetical protein